MQGLRFGTNELFGKANYIKIEVNFDESRGKKCQKWSEELARWSELYERASERHREEP